MAKKDTDVGKDTEQRVARWLREDGGFPHAERTVRTGYRTAARELVDAGDIDGTPGIVWQIKSLRPAVRAEREVPGWLLETEVQRAAAGASVGLLVVRRWGTTDVGRWWCFLTAADLFGLADGFGGAAMDPGVLMPVRLEVRHMVALLRGWGWGAGEAETDPAEDENAGGVA